MKIIIGTIVLGIFILILNLPSIFERKNETYDAARIDRIIAEEQMQTDCIANGGKLFVIGDTYKYIFCEASNGTIAKLHQM